MWLVRHAEAGQRSGWDGPDELRPLSDAGFRQAEALMTALAPTGVGRARRVLSSDYPRCRQTVEPLAAALGMGVEDAAALREETPLEEVLELLAGCGHAVLCSHGDVIGDVVLHLENRGVLEDPAEWEKGSTWVLSVAGGEVVTARYVPAPW